jgi:hypothetical protein
MGQFRPVLVLTGSGFQWALSQGQPSSLNPYTTVDADRTEENRKGYPNDDTPCPYRENCTFSRQVTRAKVNQLVHSDLQDPDNVADLRVGEKVLVVDTPPTSREMRSLVGAESSAPGTVASASCSTRSRASIRGQLLNVDIFMKAFSEGHDRLTGPSIRHS